MVIESGHLVENDSYTVEELVGTMLQIAIKQKYIDRDDLTANGKKLLSDAEKHELDGN